MLSKLSNKCRAVHKTGASRAGVISTSGEVVAATSAFANVSSVGEYTLTIAAGVTLRKLTTNGFPVGSKLTIINQGSILGYGGKGGAGSPYTLVANTSDGAAGQDAIDASLDLVIDNTSGYIFGGGGGGACGYQVQCRYSAASLCIAFVSRECVPGGGGVGGGAGNQAWSSWSLADMQNGTIHPGVSSTAGTMSAPGVRAGALTNTGWYGGNGGNWGEAGETGWQFTNIGFNGAGYPGWTTTHAAGGAGGYAVRKNGHSVTWIGGNIIERVKGMVA